MVDRRDGLTDAQEHVMMRLVQLYSQQVLPAGLINRAFETHVDLFSRDLVLQLRAFAIGDEGPQLFEKHEWEQYRFPWYTPKWLRRRRTTKKTITLTFQGKVIYPEQRVVPVELGKPTGIVEFYVWGEKP